MYNYFQQAESLGVDAILNQCSSVGEVADAIKPFVRVPVVKVDEAMAEKAVSLGKKIAVVATVPTTVGPSVRLVEQKAKEMGIPVEKLVTHHYKLEEYVEAMEKNISLTGVKIAICP